MSNNFPPFGVLIIELSFLIKCTLHRHPWSDGLFEIHVFFFFVFFTHIDLSYKGLLPTKTPAPTNSSTCIDHPGFYFMPYVKWIQQHPYKTLFLHFFSLHFCIKKQVLQSSSCHYFGMILAIALKLTQIGNVMAKG